MSEAELDEYERWLDIPDQQIFAWVNGSEAAPAEFDTALFRRLRDFHRGGANMSDRNLPPNCCKPGKALTLAQVADGAEGLVLADLARAIAARDQCAGDFARA